MGTAPQSLINSLELTANLSPHDREIIDGLARAEKNIIRKLGSPRTDALRKASLTGLAMSLGIAVDKRAQLMGNVPTRNIKHTHTLADIQGKPLNRQQLINKIKQVNSLEIAGRIKQSGYVDMNSKVSHKMPGKRQLPVIDVQAKVIQPVKRSNPHGFNPVKPKPHLNP